MLSCKDVSKLLSESLDRRLPLWKRANLWMHLSMCRLCRGFRKDLIHLHRETGQLAGQIDGAAVEPNASLSPESRERMKRLLEPRQP